MLHFIERDKLFAITIILMLLQKKYWFYGTSSFRFNLGLADLFVEALALDGGNFELESGGLARSVRPGESASAPWRSTVNFVQVRQQTECLGVTQRNIDDSVVCEGGHGCYSCGFLSSSGSASGDEYSSILPVQTARGPELASGVPEGLPLCWEVTVTSGNTEQECIEGGEFLRGDDFVVGLGRGVHLGEDLCRKGLSDLEDGNLSSCALNASLLSLGELGNMAVHRVDDDGDFGRRHGTFGSRC